MSGVVWLVGIPVAWGIGLAVAAKWGHPQERDLNGMMVVICGIAWPVALPLALFFALGAAFTAVLPKQEGR
jgi:hypothetical protein